MTRRNRGVALLAVQLTLVLSIVGKYAYERMNCPRVWVRAVQVDPELPIRGRYIALHLAVDACALPRTNEDAVRWIGPDGTGYQQWTAKIEAKGGKLIGVPATGQIRPEQTEELTRLSSQPCDRAFLSEPVDYFIGDRAKLPFPLKSSEELWAELTVPPSGPPRPIQLAISSESGFKPLAVR